MENEHLLIYIIDRMVHHKLVECVFTQKFWGYEEKGKKKISFVEKRLIIKSY